METIYTVKQKEISLNLQKDSFTLWFFGDVHRDTASCDVDRWHWFLDRAKKDKGAYFFGMGDYFDFASTREKRKLQSSELHETTMQRFDAAVEADIRGFAKECSFMQGSLLGLIGGNHGWKFQNGKLADEDLAERLQTEYLGWLCHYTIKFIDSKSDRRFQLVDFVLCHGRAGGKTFGITINQVGDLKSIFPIADIYCMGHDHQRGAWPVSVLLRSKDNEGEVYMKQKRQFLCRSGSFKKAYVDGHSGYETGRLLRPADLGALKLNISFHRDKKNGKDRVITDIEAII